jgi:hypothetical protein
MTGGFSIIREGTLQNQQIGLLPQFDDALAIIRVARIDYGSPLSIHPKTDASLGMSHGERLEGKIFEIHLRFPGLMKEEWIRAGFDPMLENAPKFGVEDFKPLRAYNMEWIGPDEVNRII